MTSSPTVRRADLNTSQDREALAQCLIDYSADPMGGGKALDGELARKSVALMAELSTALCFLAEHDGKAVGLANCFMTVSTFTAKPAINIHDLSVAKTHRRLGIGRALLHAIEQEALTLGCAKITLEVLEGNTAARKAYADVGFAPYFLDPEMGSALFLQKFLTP